MKHFIHISVMGTRGSKGNKKSIHLDFISIEIVETLETGNRQTF